LAIKDGNGIKVLYRLMLSVNVLRDGRALPEAAAVQAEMTKVISRFLSANRGGVKTDNQPAFLFAVPTVTPRGDGSYVVTLSKPKQWVSPATRRRFAAYRKTR
jgi:hypothetical protein